MECLTIDMLMQDIRLSQFKNFSFNSMASVYGRFLGANTAGLYALLEGEKDNTTPIVSEFTLASTDFGVHNAKKVRRLYFGFYSEGNLVITVSADKTPSVDVTLAIDANGQGRGSVTIPLTMRGKYWTIKVSSPSGVYFAINSIDVLLIPFSEGLQT